MMKTIAAKEQIGKLNGIDQAADHFAPGAA